MQSTIRWYWQFLVDSELSPKHIERPNEPNFDFFLLSFQSPEGNVAVEVHLLKDRISTEIRADQLDFTYEGSLAMAAHLLTVCNVIRSAQFRTGASLNAFI